MAAITSWTYDIKDAAPADILLDNNELGGSVFPKIIGNSVALQQVLDLVRMVAPTDSTVLIQGETGTGKEMIAEAIHECSDRSSGPFVKVSCLVTSAAPTRGPSRA